MRLRERIFDLIFHDRRKKRLTERRPSSSGRKKKRAVETERDEFDGRYFIRHRR